MIQEFLKRFASTANGATAQTIRETVWEHHFRGNVSSFAVRWGGGGGGALTLTLKTVTVAR